MSPRTPEDPRAVRNRLIWEDAFAWIGRIFATMVFMVGPGLAGLWLDRRFDTKFLAAVGIVIGMALGTAALLILVNVKRPTLEEDTDELSKASDDPLADGSRSLNKRESGTRGSESSDANRPGR